MQSAILVLAAALVAIPALLSASAPAAASPEVATAKQCMAGYVWDERAQRCRKVPRGSY